MQARQSFTCSPCLDASPDLPPNAGAAAPSGSRPPGQPDADILTARAGLAGVPHLEVLGQGDIVTYMNPPGHEVSETHLWPPRSCIARPQIQTITGLPAGTSAPSTVLTEPAVRALGEQLVPDGWLIPTAAPLTPGPVSTAR
jgi:hypothetical protein